jgi:RNase P/RNase MRP subunit p29
MKPMRWAGLLAMSLWLEITPTQAEGPNKYQVTGQIVEITETTLVLQKGDEKWELARKKTTKGSANLKVGDKITVYYHMVADEVTAKPTGKPGKTAKSDKSPATK